ncbi:MAG: bifunctional metallophosphatase/5'-nucleotidase [Nitrosopumilus sp.]|nr:bifunctional metallophosphatase/5'-nucleotidase [Nitrosopumilus sp.]
MLESHDISSIEKINKLLDKNPKGVLIHITDTYFIEESSVNGIIDLPGFARFLSMIDNIRSNPTIKKNKTPVLVLHGGDFLYPSLMSLYFQGSQMIDVLNLCRFNYCTLGNHDFEGGTNVLKTRMSEALFEIICVNIKNPKNKKILEISDYVTAENNRAKPFAAITGVAGKATLRKAKQNGFVTTTAKTSLKQTISKIKKNHPEVNYLIILSHMSNKEDVNLERWLAKNWDGYLYLLGGHDHNEILRYDKENPKSILLKGQSNCRTVQIIGIPRVSDLKKTDQLSRQVVVISSAELSKFHPEAKMQKKIMQWESDLERHIDKIKSKLIIKQFKTDVILDATELQLRKGSTNFGNFVADCILKFTDSDIVFINSGHFRGDRKIGNVIRMLDLYRVFVLDKKDSLVKIAMTRTECIKFLRHAYSEEGRGKILQVSKNTYKILQESKSEEKLSVTMLWDMIKTNDDGFTTLLAKSRKTTIENIITKLEKNIIPNSSLFEVIKKSSKYVEYDPSMRISLEKIRLLKN